MANVNALIRQLADSMKASHAPEDSDRMATIDAAANTTGAVAFEEKLLAYLDAKYGPIKPLSAELRAKLGAGIPEITE